MTDCLLTIVVDETSRDQTLSEILLVNTVDGCRSQVLGMERDEQVPNGTSQRQDFLLSFLGIQIFTWDLNSVMGAENLIHSTH